MDHYEWNLECSENDIGTDIGNTTENLRLLSIATTTFFPTDSRNKDTWWEKGTEEATRMQVPRDEQSEDNPGETECVGIFRRKRGRGHKENGIHVELDGRRR